jgi:hypothetical protein
LKLITIIFTTVIFLGLNNFAMAQNSLNCSHIEAAVHEPQFISMSKMSAVEDLQGKKLLIASAQVAKALEILDVVDITQYDEYYYKLNLFNKKYDAINLQINDKSHTIVFKENTSIQMNFLFEDGEIYINDMLCDNVILPGKIQF